MALETVVFPQQDPFTYSYKDNYFNSLNNDYDHLHADAEEQENVLLGIINNEQQNLHANWDHQWEYSHSSSPEICTVDQTITAPPSSTVEEATTVTASCRRKRRRIKSAKNKEEIENQRMTHITVERNRRKQMNEYLNVLRSLMPSSYVQRGDQASIIGGAINFVKELEQHLQSMGGQKKTKEPNENIGLNNGPPFAEFFTFPQYTTSATQNNNNNNVTMEQHNYQEQKQWAVADIEVTMVDSHANMKILSKKKPGQLMKIVVGLQNLRLTILHLNVTTVDDMVLYSVSIKVEEGSQLNSVDEIAAAVNQLLRTVQQELAYQLN